MPHKIIKRHKEYVSMDSYGLVATCSCGKKITGWREDEIEEKVKLHLSVDKIIRGLKRGIKSTDKDYMDDKSWGYENGILLSANEAQALLNELTNSSL